MVAWKLNVSKGISKALPYMALDLSDFIEMEIWQWSLGNG